MMRALALGILAAALSAETLTVEVSGVRSSKGSVRALLYRGKDGYPTKPEKAIAKAAVAAVEPAVLVFSDVAPGEYAVAAYHDENGNGKLDANFIGIPKEPVGASNDAKGRMGPPPYEKARFAAGGNLTIRIRLSR